jgi:MraZ protein
MFRGNHPTRVDEKGRLKLPVDHRRTVDKLYGNDFFITSRDGKVVEIWPMKEWERIETELADLPASAAKKKFIETTNYYGQVVEFDGQGRLLVPQILREDSEMASVDVAVVGMQKYLAVNLDSRHRERMKADPVTDADVEQIGIKGL